MDPAFLPRGAKFSSDAVIVENEADAVVEIVTNEDGVLVVRVLAAPRGGRPSQTEAPLEVEDVQTG